MGIRQWFNNPEEKRAFNEVERTWPDLAQWADDATDARKNKAAVARLFRDGALAYQYRAAIRQFWRFRNLVLRAVPGLATRMRDQPAVATALDFSGEGLSAWQMLAETGVFLASRVSGSEATLATALATKPGGTAVRALIVDQVLNAALSRTSSGVSQSNAFQHVANLCVSRSGRLKFQSIGTPPLNDLLKIGTALVAGPWRIFDFPGELGAVRFSRGEDMCPVAPEVYPHWWGVDTHPTSIGGMYLQAVTNRIALSLALDCFPQQGLVVLPAGEYPINATVVAPNGNALLKGEHPDGATIRMTTANCTALRYLTSVENLRLVGPYQRKATLQEFVSNAAQQVCGIDFRGTAVMGRNLSISGFPVGIHARANGFDVAVPDEATKFNMSLTWLRNIRFENVDWGFVCNTAANGLSLDGIRARDAGVGILFPKVLRANGLFHSAPESSIAIRRAVCEGVLRGIAAGQNLVAPLFELSRFNVSDAGIVLVPDGLSVGPGEVGPCLFEGAGKDVVATTGTGNAPLPWLVIARSGGMGAAPPIGGTWETGDRVENDLSAAKEGDPGGWVRRNP